MENSIQKYWKETTLRANSDILFECFVGLLINSKVHKDENIHVLPTENFKRRYRFDMVRLEEDQEYFERTGTELLKIHTSRQSIIDYLPEIFYASNTYDFVEKKGEDPEKRRFRLEQFRKRHQNRINSAKNFFKPLEVQYNKVRIDKELKEVKLLEEQNNLLETFWERFPVESLEEQRFVNTLHLLPYTVGNIELTQQLIEYTLQKKVSIKLTIREKAMLPDRLKPKMDECLLGYNTNVGSEVFEYLPICTVTIEGLSKVELSKYLNKSISENKLLAAIEKYYFPLDVEVQYNFEVKREMITRKKQSGEEYLVAADQFFLGAEAGTGEGVAGFSTRI